MGDQNLNTDTKNADKPELLGLTCSTMFTFAETQSVCYGHGDYGEEQKIVRTGLYGSGDFPPVFRFQEAAMDWIKKQDTGRTYKLVEIKVYC